MVPEEWGIVKFERVGYGYELPRLDLDGHRLIVVHPVGVVDQARLGHQVGGALRAGDRGAEHALELLPRVALQRINAVPVKLPLLLFGVAVEVTSVVDAMAHEVPITLHHGFGDLGVMFQHRQVEGHTTLDFILVQHLQHTPESHPVAVVAVGILLHVRIWRAGPRVSNTVVVGQILVVFNVGSYPERNSSIVGPLDDGAVYDGAVVNAVRGQRHGGHLRVLSEESNTANSTSKIDPSRHHPLSADIPQLGDASATGLWPFVALR